ncbi:hypothetical protein BDC45DRAFT_302524 [Circinella umbellata]|nr:hypothetical protein BDC45DRAFT_302524 [Circinella umbellata]
MLNELIKSGVQDSVVGGILLKGYQMSTYKLYLKHPHIYTLIEISNISSFRNMESMTLLPSILRSLIQLKKRTSDKANRISATYSPPLWYISTATYNLRKRPDISK